MIEIIRGLTTRRASTSSTAPLRHPEHQDLPGADRADPDPDRRPLRGGAPPRRAPRRRLDARAAATPTTLARLIGGSRELRREYGREREPFEIHVISLDAYTPDGVQRLEELGVTDVIVGFRDVYGRVDEPLQKKIDALRRYADDVIAKA